MNNITLYDVPGTMSDSYGRRLSYLRVSLTDACNLRCVYCMPEDIRFRPAASLLQDDEILTLVRVAASLGVNKIRLTGGEPLVRPGVVRLIERIASIPGIQDLGLTTNAMLLAKNAPLLAQAGLKRVNISLDTLSAYRFRRITRLGTFEQAWEGILAAEQAGLAPIKLNAVIVRKFNDDELHALARLSTNHPWQIRFIELMPIGNTQNWGEGLPALEDRYVSVQEMHTRLANLGLKPVEPSENSGPARMFLIPGALGTIGFISPLGDHFCQNCNRLRLTADGKLRPCLVLPGEISLRDALRNNQPLEDLFLHAVAIKPQQHNLVSAIPAVTQHGMSQIGG